MNVAEYEYVDYFDPDDEGIDDHIEIYAGNYMFCDKSQGAWIVGFKLFRALLGHLDLSQPRRLKGEKYGAVQVRRRGAGV